MNANFGMVIREEPDTTTNVVSRVANGGIVELLGEEQVDNFGNRWLLVLNPEDDVTGWVQSGLVVTATPQEPETVTPTVPTATPTEPSSTNTPTATSTATAEPTRTATTEPTATGTAEATATP